MRSITWFALGLFAGFVIFADQRRQCAPPILEWIAPAAHAAAAQRTKTRRIRSATAPRRARGQRGRAAARATPQDIPARAAASQLQPGDATPIRPTEVPTVRVVTPFQARFQAVYTKPTQENAR